MTVTGADRPRLAPHVRLSPSTARRGPVLLLPETVVVLNSSGAEILRLCDGRSVDAIVGALAGRYRDVAAHEVGRFLSGLVERRWVVVDRAG